MTIIAYEFLYFISFITIAPILTNLIWMTMRTMMIVIILSNLFSKTADILRVGLVCTFVTHWQDRQGQAGDSNQIQSWKTWEAESMSLPRPGRKSRRCPLDLKHQTGTVWIRAGCFLRHKKLNQNKAPSDTFTKLTTIKKKKKTMCKAACLVGEGRGWPPLHKPTCTHPFPHSGPETAWSLRTEAGRTGNQCQQMQVIMNLKPALQNRKQFTNKNKQNIRVLWRPALSDTFKG